MPGGGRDCCCRRGVAGGGRAAGAAEQRAPVSQPAARGGVGRPRTAPHQRLPPAAALRAPRRREERRRRRQGKQPGEASGAAPGASAGRPSSRRSRAARSPPPRLFPKAPFPRALSLNSSLLSPPRFKLARVFLASHLHPPSACSRGSPLQRSGRTSPRSAVGLRRPAAVPAAAPFGCRHNRCRGGARAGAEHGERGGLGPSGLLSSVLGVRRRADLLALLQEVVSRRLGW